MRSSGCVVLYAFYPTPAHTSILPKVALKPNFPNELLDRVQCHIDPSSPPPCLVPWLAAPLTAPPPAEEEEEEEMVSEEEESTDADSDEE